MFDFSVLQANADNPTLMSVVYAMLFAFLLAIVVAFTYEKTTRDLYVPGHFIQAMILGAMAASTIMLAIGDSLARGLGMIGALAIIHFRTNLRDPRNIIFMFAALAVGISCGVHGYNIAFIGTVGFCGVAFLLRWTPFSNQTQMVTTLRFRLDEQHGASMLEAKKLLETHAEKHLLWRSDVLVEANGDIVTAFSYHLVIHRKSTAAELVRSLSGIPGLSKIELSSRSETEAL